MRTILSAATEYAKLYKEEVNDRLKEDTTTRGGVNRFLTYIAVAEKQLNIMEADQKFRMTDEKYERKDIEAILEDTKKDLDRIIDELKASESEIKTSYAESTVLRGWEQQLPSDLPEHKKKARDMMMMRCEHFLNRFIANTTKLTDPEGKCKCLDSIEVLKQALSQVQGFQTEFSAKREIVVNNEEQAMNAVAEIRKFFETIQPTMEALKMN